MQLAPKGTSYEAVKAAVEGLPGVCAAHDLHIWTLDGRRTVLSGHLVIDGPTDPARARHGAEVLLEETFGVGHTTRQLERAGEPCRPTRSPTPAPAAPGPSGDRGAG